MKRLLLSTLLAVVVTQADAATLLNVSYDVARGLYKDINPAFAAEWKKTTGEDLVIDQSHGGSSKQARAVIDGLEADVVTMNSPIDIDVIAKAGLLAPDWAGRLPQASSPSWSAIVFIVRKGNPKAIRDWSDLVKPGVAIVLPNPKTSGNGRYSYLAAWRFAATRPGASPEAPLAFVRDFLAHAPILATGGRDATTSFAQNGIGDALLTFESESRTILETFGADKVEVVYPSLTVRADNPVALVDENVERRGTRKVAEAYLRFHYDKAAQEIFARSGLRAVDAAVSAAHATEFPPINTFTVDDAFGGWAHAQAEHFAEGGSFDRVIADARK